MRTQRMNAAARKEQILAASLTVFASRGYHLTRTRDLAEAAGISEPLLYRHFASKQALYLALLENLGQELLEAWDFARSSAAHPDEVFKLFGLGFFGTMMSSPEKAKMVFQSFTEVGNPAVLGFSRGIQLQFHERVTALVREGMSRGLYRSDLDPELTAWRYISIGYTASVMGVLGLQEQLSHERILAWGDGFVESLAI